MVPKDPVWSKTTSFPPPHSDSGTSSCRIFSSKKSQKDRSQGKQLSLAPVNNPLIQKTIKGVTWPSCPSRPLSVTEKRQQAPVLSGMEAWSVFLSFLKTIFPSCSTDDTTLSMARGEERRADKAQTSIPTSSGGLESKSYWGANLHLSRKKTQF